MYDAVWAAEYRGVKMCTTKELIAKPERDWSVFLLKEKCDSGMCQIMKMQFDFFLCKEMVSLVFSYQYMQMTIWLTSSL